LRVVNGMGVSAPWQTEAAVAQHALETV
jgi:hypothetical protein